MLQNPENLYLIVFVQYDFSVTVGVLTETKNKKTVIENFGRQPNGKLSADAPTILLWESHDYSDELAIETVVNLGLPRENLEIVELTMDESERRFS